MANEHERVMEELAKHFKPLFDESPDGVYLWLDEQHTICNERLARMLGISVEDWRNAPPFLDTFVGEGDRHHFAWNYQNRVANLAFPATFRFRAIRKDGSSFEAETDMIPISFSGHAVAYHFVRQIGD